MKTKPMLYRKLLLLAPILLSACVTVNPSILTSEQMVLESVQVASRNQAALIDAYTDDQKTHVVELMESSVIDKVIKDKAGGGDSLSTTEVKALLVEYTEDLSAEFAKIDVQGQRLHDAAQADFEILETLVRNNIAYINSLVQLSSTRDRLLGRNKKRLDKVEAKFISILDELAPDENGGE